MVAVRCSADTVTQAIAKLGVDTKASVASVNGPKSVAIAGAEAEVKAVLAELFDAEVIVFRNVTSFLPPATVSLTSPRIAAGETLFTHFC